MIMQIAESLNMQEAAEQQKKLFGDRLRTLRINAGMSQKTLAERAGFKPPVIARYESGRVLPRPKAIKRLADALGVPVSHLDGSDTSAASKVKLSEMMANDLQKFGIKVGFFKDDSEAVTLTGPGIGKITMSFLECLDLIQETTEEVDALLAKTRDKYFDGLFKAKLQKEDKVTAPDPEQ